MINFLMIMEKAVCTWRSISLKDQKIKSNNCHFLCVGRLINILVLFLLQHLNWIERYSTMKIGRFFFVWVYVCIPYRNFSDLLPETHLSFYIIWIWKKLSYKLWPSWFRPSWFLAEWSIIHNQHSAAKPKFWMCRCHFLHSEALKTCFCTFHLATALF